MISKQSSNNSPMKIDRFIKDSLHYCWYTGRSFSPKFQLEENYETTDNTFSIPSNNMGVNNSMSYSRSSVIDQYALDIENKYTDNKHWIQTNK